MSSPLPGAGRSVAVGVGAIEVARAGRLVSYALGSCIGIVVVDRATGIGGMAHVLLPSSKTATFAGDAFTQPGRFADTAVPALFRALIAAGAPLERPRIVIAGGAAIGGGMDHFQIGSRNLTAVRKAMWLAGHMIEVDDTGGGHPRTLSLELPAGLCTVSTHGKYRTL